MAKKKFKTYISTPTTPVTISHLPAKKYTPEELCKLMGVCGDGLDSIRLHYRQWGYEKMSLMGLMETAAPEDFSEGGDMKRNRWAYMLQNFSELRSRILDALNLAIVFKKFPYLWRKEYDDSYIEVAETSVSDFDDSAHLSIRCNTHPYTDDEKNEIVYQMLYDAANGLLPMEIYEVAFELDDGEDADYGGSYRGEVPLVKYSNK